MSGYNTLFYGKSLYPLRCSFKLAVERIDSLHGIACLLCARIVYEGNAAVDAGCQFGDSVVKSVLQCVETAVAVVFEDVAMPPFSGVTVKAYSPSVRVRVL